MLSTVVARGTGTTRYDYQWRDATLARQQPAAGYYRLRQVDTDGTSRYSLMRGAALAATTLSLHPNPVAGKTMLTGAAPGAAVRLLDLLGRPVAVVLVDGTGTALLSLPPGLPTGVYLM